MSRQKDNNTKREFHIVTSGKFRTLVMFFMWDGSSDVLKLCVVSCDKVVTATRRPLHLRELCWALLGKTLYLFQRICQPPSGFEMDFLPSLPQPF